MQDRSELSKQLLRFSVNPEPVNGYEYLSSQRFFHPKDPVESYARAARIYFACCRKGITVRSTIDCLIAQIALEHDLFLLHNDSDFIATVPRLLPETYQIPWGYA